MRVLFVDDEPNILSGLRRLLRSLNKEWDMVFAGSGAAALESVKKEPCDVVVSDMKMPGMDGAELLSEIRERHPETIRIALSGETDSNMIYRCVQHAHQYISKPCEAEVLIDTVRRAYNMREMMKDPKLQSLISSISSLRSSPEQYQRIIEELESEKPSLQNIAHIVEIDIAMTAKLLQMVNSAFFGLSRHISSPQEAVTFLGINVIKSLVLTTRADSQFTGSAIKPEWLNAIGNQSSQVGNLAQKIAAKHTDQKLMADNALQGGLLADIGKLIFANSLSEAFMQVQILFAEGHLADWEAERQIIGYSHAEIGAYLIGLWGLPDPIVECVAYHHTPANCADSSFTALSAVHIANAIVVAAGHSDLTELDFDYIDKLGVRDQLPEWTALYNSVSATDGEFQNG